MAGIGGRGGDCVVDIVVKVGGAVLRDPAVFSRTTGDLARVPRTARVLIVAGGGPFADTVRAVDHEIGLGDDAAHWLAVLAMDQCAHALAAHVVDGRVVEEPDAVGAAFAEGQIPVLAPYRWLRRVDPLPHSWDVTSDSIAAWVAVVLRARHLVLVKPVVRPLAEVTDGHFARAVVGPVLGVPAIHLCTAGDAARVVTALTPAVAAGLPADSGSGPSLIP